MAGHEPQYAQRPEISVVMPVYNAEPWLDEAIDSIKRQTLRQLELIIVDDGSTDASWSIACDAAAHDSRIRVYRRQHSGICAALNEGITLARAALIARMDADDVAHPERLEKQREFFANHPAVGAAGTWAAIIDEQGAQTGQLTPYADPDRLRDFLLHQNPFVHASMAVRGSVIQAVGGYRDIVRGAEDYDLWLRISEHADLANIPEFLTKHRRHSASATTREPIRQLVAARVARQAAERRRGSQPDFLETWTPPLRLETVEKIPELRPLTAVFRLLEASDSYVADAHDLRVFGQAQLNHAERRAAQFWLWQHYKMASTLKMRGLMLFWLVRLHPARALKLVFCDRE